MAKLTPVTGKSSAAIADGLDASGGSRFASGESDGISRGEIRAAAMTRGLSVKRNNALTAMVSGGVLAIAAAETFGAGWHGLVRDALGFALGIFAGLIYANAFEYTLHRFALHWGNGFLAQRHALHHDSKGAPDEARYVNFATSRWVVVLVFLLNAPMVLIAGHFLGGATAAGMFAGFTCYFVAYEEIHWRIHFGGLPAWMAFSRRHHMRHHSGRPGHNNVFLPIFDWVFDGIAVGIFGRTDWR